MTRVGGSAILMATMLAVTMATCGAVAGAPADATTRPAEASAPNPQLGAQDVVRIVVEALGQNDADDSGIRLSWKFASPSNQQVTGPLERFIPMVKNPLYAPLLHRQTVEYGELRSTGARAAQLVMLRDGTGNRAWFLFELSKQTDGPLRGCWMTDGVMRVRPQNFEKPATQPVAPMPGVLPALPPGSVPA
jgi:hypothetical protein